MTDSKHMAAHALKDVILEMAAGGHTHGEITVKLSETTRARVLITIAAIETGEQAPGDDA